MVSNCPRRRNFMSPSIKLLRPIIDKGITFHTSMSQGKLRRAFPGATKLPRFSLLGSPILTWSSDSSDRIALAKQDSRSGKPTRFRRGFGECPNSLTRPTPRPCTTPRLSGRSLDKPSKGTLNEIVTLTLTHLTGDSLLVFGLMGLFEFSHTGPAHTCCRTFPGADSFSLFWVWQRCKLPWSAMLSERRLDLCTQLKYAVSLSLALIVTSFVFMCHESDGRTTTAWW